MSRIVSRQNKNYMNEKGKWVRTKIYKKLLEAQLPYFQKRGSEENI